jgi:hypothetical protein
LSKQGERAVLSGQHGTRDEARAALESEAAKSSQSSFDPSTGDWQITDNAGLVHRLMIDPF